VEKEAGMKKKEGMWAILPVILICLFFAGCATVPSGQKDFSWYGKSGAKKAPAYDREKCGYWWMPEKAPAGKENIQWGNRGYVFVAEAQKKAARRVAPRPAPMVKESIVLKDVFFAKDSAGLSSASIQTIKENAGIIKKRGLRVLLVGSASPEGKADYNLKLSERRVNAVKDYLVKKEGISEDLIGTEAKGAIPADKAAWPSVRKVKFMIRHLFSR